MNQEIKYSGFSAVPSDYECQDGSLAASVNLVCEDGALQPVFQPASIMRLPSGCSVIHLHKTSVYEHYIILRSSDNAVFWTPSSATSPTLDDSNRLGTFTSYNHVNSIGNTLLVVSSSGISYFLWNSDAYNALGDHIPELPLSFGLQGERAESDEAFEVSIGESFDRISDFTDDVKASVTGQVLAKVNKFIADNYTYSGRFMYPFFVRYALRLYDGSLTMHSAPVLMVCATEQNPYVLAQTLTYNSESLVVTALKQCKVYAALYKLDFAVTAQKYIDALKPWDDIVKSVDIFVSAPLYSFDQSGEVSGIDLLADTSESGASFSRNFNGYCVCKATHGGDYAAHYQYHSMKAFFWYGKSAFPGYSLRLPQKGHDSQLDNVTSASLFYLLKSYPLAELSTSRKVVSVDDGYFQSLLAREVMTDDYDSHANLAPKCSFVYNSRLNIAAIDKAFPLAFHTASMLNFTDGFLQPLDGDFTKGVDRTYDSTKQQVAMFVYVKSQGKNFAVRSLDISDTVFGLFSETEVAMFTPTPFIFYPDTNAYKAVIWWRRWLDDGSESNVYRSVNLSPHPTLNGSYYFSWDDPAGSEVSSVNRGSSDIAYRTVPLPNKIYTSEVNNPFLFLATGVNTVGTGTIRGVCAAAKALSQGQFGQFPLYAFTTDGVWALEVSSTGSYSTRQPITRDVCSNAKGIAQLDSAVLFPTDRGIMLISGSQTTCISEAINSEFPFDATSLPGFAKLHAMLGHPTTDNTPTTGGNACSCLPTLAFSEFLGKCRMLYDYRHQRVIVYAPSISYAYVYSLKTQQWGMMFSTIDSHFNSYPDALANTADCRLVSFSSTDDSQAKCLCLTRPLKLGAPDVLKTVDCVIQRGFFRRGDVATVLYGSRDLVHWHLLWSSTDHFLQGFRGSPYKYFRIAGVATLNADENIFGASVQFSPRQANQPR